MIFPPHFVFLFEVDTFSTASHKRYTGDIKNKPNTSNRFNPFILILVLVFEEAFAW